MATHVWSASVERSAARRHEFLVLFLFAEYVGVSLNWDDRQDTGFPNFPGLRIIELPPLDAPDLASSENQKRTLLQELLSECALIDMYPESKSRFIRDAPGKGLRIPVPERGDIVSVLADSKEKLGRRTLVLVLSPRVFNAFGQVVVCPIMQGNRFSRAHGFA